MLGIDGNAIEMATLGFGLLSVFVRPIRCFKRGHTAWNRQKVVTDFLNGASIVPFAVMFGSAFWTQLVDEVVKSKTSLGLAGAIGLVFIIGEVLNAGKENSNSFPPRP